MAEQGFIKDGVNRVLLATDGDFNVGSVLPRR
jgi:Ca-activated chloride channel family protein